MVATAIILYALWVKVIRPFIGAVTRLWRPLITLKPQPPFTPPP
ncbi:hypothetical protein [Caldivirga maquilingensis]|nr:hypothetical protein [Caldivirga maquilingensis]